MIIDIYQKYSECNFQVSTDTRKIKNSALFIALKGPNFNANKLAKEALNKGAKYAIIDDDNYYIDNRTILVKDCLSTLQELARHHRKKLDIPVIGITGTNGKTTTKELIGAVLKEKYKVLITQGNLNNHIGVPLTLLELRSFHNLAVIEMGASKKGDIKELVDICLPNYGIITNIGIAHIEGFGSFNNVLSTKKELFDYLDKNNGTIFCNDDDDVLKENIPRKTNSIFYSKSKGNISGEIISNNPFVNFKWGNHSYTSEIINTQLVGEYNFYNILAAICIGSYFKLDNQLINKAIIEYKPSNNRSQLLKTNNNTIIVDCYNANPSSTLNALNSFMNIEAENKMVILGDMLELGDISIEEHQKIADLLESNKIKAYLVGREYCKSNTRYKCFDNVNLFIEYFKTENKITDFTILLKGSRGIKLETILEKNII